VSVEPRYRILMFPHRVGEKLPETTWESADVVAVRAGGTTHRIRFASAADGSPRMEVLP
jgi:hypothetical protein